MDFIPINKPLLGEEERAAVRSVLESGLLTDSSYEGGKYVQQLEAKMRRLLKSKHVVALNSGTAALHVALLALSVKPGDEVIVPSFTFLSTANVVLACGAKPVFADVKEDYNIDPAQVRKKITKKTKAIIPVHLYGYPADMDEVRAAAAARSIPVVEDAAESLGAEYKGRQTGTMGTMGCFSLYATKVMTSGEGGAVSTDDDELADRLRMARNHGMVHGYDSRMLGFNYRLPEVTAAIGSVQMGRLAGFLRARRKNARYLSERLRGHPGVEIRQSSRDRSNVFYLYTLHVRKNRDKVQSALVKEGVGAAVYWSTPVHKTPLYEELGYSRLRLPRTDDAAAHVLSLPVHPGVTPEELERVADKFTAAAKRLLK